MHMMLEMDDRMSKKDCGRSNLKENKLKNVVSKHLKKLTNYVHPTTRVEENFIAGKDGSRQFS